MSDRAERLAEDAYEAENDYSAPVSGTYNDASYAHETGTQGFSKGIPVQSDDADYDDPMQPPYSNSNQQLAQDEREAIDKSNIIRGKGRSLRHSKPQAATKYSEGPDEDDLPQEAFETGQSSTKRVL
ncbi:uncharacterized protein DSM5745_10563 [Aspergillus mulundensis]|uniref:Histone chaperone domain-containing protein n=1 Tax=Aspergillus mulundensis TaxID=1810919 RepID=A0A3D8QJJ9_9EURO|nr:Uncharacterized protein DSM5745_10563 [Aspergillus mulundensis]RDW61891.1 Uncharacterized protein DSM5745_10563 [Aspergillus mulundensis]